MTVAISLLALSLTLNGVDGAVLVGESLAGIPGIGGIDISETV
jgi:hypothetical protein